MKEYLNLWTLESTEVYLTERKEDGGEADSRHGRVFLIGSHMDLKASHARNSPLFYLFIFFLYLMSDLP